MGEGRTVGVSGRGQRRSRGDAVPPVERPCGHRDVQRPDFVVGEFGNAALARDAVPLPQIIGRIWRRWGEGCGAVLGKSTAPGTPPARRSADVKTTPACPAAGARPEVKQRAPKSLASCTRTGAGHRGRHDAPRRAQGGQAMRDSSCFCQLLHPLSIFPPVGELITLPPRPTLLSKSHSPWCCRRSGAAPGARRITLDAKRNAKRQGNECRSKGECPACSAGRRSACPLHGPPPPRWT